MATAVLAAALAGCGGEATAPTASPAPPTAPTTSTVPAPVTITTAATTTSPPPATSRPAPSSTTSTTTVATTTTGPAPTAPPAPDEPWHVPGRRYYFPVQPPAVADYGADHHDYPATDIFAPRGSTLVAVTDGMVDEVSRVDVWDPATNDPAARGGRYVSIVGDDGVRYYYSHLESVSTRLAPQQRVRAGEAIGTVGTSGNARETPPHVHFGISRPSFAGDWEVRRGEVWPYDYLQAWSEGRDVTPEVP